MYVVRWHTYTITIIVSQMWGSFRLAPTLYIPAAHRPQLILKLSPLTLAMFHFLGLPGCLESPPGAGLAPPQSGAGSRPWHKTHSNHSEVTVYIIYCKGTHVHVESAYTDKKRRCDGNSKGLIFAQNLKKDDYNKLADKTPFRVTGSTYTLCVT